MTDAEAVLDLWLNEVGQSKWYEVDPEVDRKIAEKFSALWEDAMAGKLADWLIRADSALALVILLDQFPRNMFRGTPEAFASDARARSYAKTAIAMGHDKRTAEPQRQFFYLPLMHSEVLPDQERCVRLIKLGLPQCGDDNLDHALKHREVIRRFGRFPSRNPILGREDSQAEQAYRAEGGYMS